MKLPEAEARRVHAHCLRLARDFKKRKPRFCEFDFFFGAGVALAKLDSAPEQWMRDFAARRSILDYSRAARAARRKEARGLAEFERLQEELDAALARFQLDPEQLRQLIERIDIDKVRQRLADDERAEKEQAP